MPRKCHQHTAEFTTAPEILAMHELAVYLVADAAAAVAGK